MACRIISHLCHICHIMPWRYSMTRDIITSNNITAHVTSPWKITSPCTLLDVVIMYMYSVPQVIKRLKPPRQPQKTVMPPWTNLCQKTSPQLPPAPPGSRRGRRPAATHSLSRSTNHSPPPLCSGCWCTQPSPCLTVSWTPKKHKSYTVMNVTFTSYKNWLCIYNIRHFKEPAAWHK